MNYNIEVDKVEEWEVNKILNKRKIKEVVKHLVQWKGFTVEHSIWKREKNLENIKEAVVEFKRRLSIEFSRQEKLDMDKE